MKGTWSARVKKTTTKIKKHHCTPLVVSRANAHRETTLSVNVMEAETRQLLSRSSIPTTEHTARCYLCMLSQPISPGLVGLDAEWTFLSLSFLYSQGKHSCLTRYQLTRWFLCFQLKPIPKDILLESQLLAPIPYPCEGKAEIQQFS